MPRGGEEIGHSPRNSSCPAIDASQRAAFSSVGAFRRNLGRPFRRLQITGQLMPGTMTSSDEVGAVKDKPWFTFLLALLPQRVVRFYCVWGRVISTLVAAGGQGVERCSGQKDDKMYVISVRETWVEPRPARLCFNTTRGSDQSTPMEG